MLLVQIIYSILQRYTYVGWEDTIVSGWGYSGLGSHVTDTLQWAKVPPPVSDATCDEAFDGIIYDDITITNSQICSGE